MKKSMLVRFAFLVVATMMLSGCFIPIPVGIERDGGHRGGHDNGRHGGSHDRR